MNYYKNKENSEEFLSTSNSNGKLNNILEKYNDIIVTLNNFEHSNPDIKKKFEILIENEEINYNNGEKLKCKNVIFLLLSNLDDEFIKKNLFNDIEEEKNKYLKNDEFLVDKILDFRKNITKNLKDRLNLSISFLERVNSFIPFFNFSKYEIYQNINEELTNIANSAKEKRKINLFWDETLIIFLILKYKPSIKLLDLIETFVLTFLAQNDFNFNPDDNVLITVNNFKLEYKILNYNNFEDEVNIINSKL
jgi:ATP-dependent Clp protease ATP-binding subunit ClpA